MKVTVIGSGVVGRLLGRALADRGEQVTLLSPNPVDEPLLWIAGDAVTGRGLRVGIEGSQVVVFAAAGRKGKAIEEIGAKGAEQVVRAVERAGGKRFILLGPTGSSTRSRARHLQAHAFAVDTCRKHMPSLSTVQLPPLFGEGDHLMSPWLERARDGRPIHVPQAKLTLRPLWVGDAKRLLLAAVDGELPEHVAVQGPSRVTVGELAATFCSRFETSRTMIGLARRPGPDELACLKEQLDGRDDWDTLKLGERLTPERWLAQQGN